MRLSQLFGQPTKTAPREAESNNARLLAQAGFIDQVAAGIYTMLPLGLRIINKIEGIIREEMNAIGGQEILMPALTPKEGWVRTDRWDKMGDILFKVKGHGEKEYALGSTHEEIVTPLARAYVHSYRDLPLALYQIQTKFRNEPRAKSGLLRGREFPMKDLYSFHASEADFQKFYERAKVAYFKVFERCGLDAKLVEASGGAFSKYSHEFQVFTEAGEDTVFYCACGWAQNKEIAEVKEGDKCPACKKGRVMTGKTIEVGNIFPLKTRFSKAFDFTVPGADGKPLEVIMGCYGIGISRVMGAIVEAHHDQAGIIWPKEVAPYAVHLLTVGVKDEAIQSRIESTADSLYESLIKEENLEALYDDRELSAGEKFADADLVGIPLRLVISERTLKESAVEWKLRFENKKRLVKLGNLHDELASF